jgi:hypothetical protein
MPRSVCANCYTPRVVFNPFAWTLNFFPVAEFDDSQCFVSLASLPSYLYIMATFTDESFSQYAEEYVNCDLTPWEFFVQATNFTIYRRRFEPKPALFEYRVIGGYPDISAKVLSKVYLDLNFRQKWDKNMLCYKELGSKEVLHFVMKYPWPLSNRDYVYQMKLKKVQTSPDRALLVIQGDSVQSYQVPIFEPPTNGVIRIDNYRQNIVIEDDGKGGSLVQVKSLTNLLISHLSN